MNIYDLNDAAVDKTLAAVCAAIQRDPERKREMLEALFEKFLDELSEDDFFGTEGWEHWAGVED